MRCYLDRLRFKLTGPPLKHLKVLLADVGFTAPVIVMHLLFEKDRFQESSTIGKKFLKGCLSGLAHNKPVEDLHCHIKHDAKSTSNKKQSAARIQLKVVQSGGLEGSEIPHYAQLTKDAFVGGFSDADANYDTNKHMADLHEISEDWGDIMGTKKWPSSTEEKLRLKAAAWNCICELATRRSQGIILGDIDVQPLLFSRFCILIASLHGLLHSKYMSKHISTYPIAHE